MKTTTKLWVWIFVLICLSPLGIIIPEHFKSGSAWGEWDVGEIQKMVGYIPKGLEKLSNLWKAPMPDYTFKGWEGKGITHSSIAYISSAIVGIAIIFLVIFLIGKILIKNKE